MTHEQQLIQLLYKIEKIAENNNQKEILKLINDYRMKRYEDSLWSKMNILITKCSKKVVYFFSRFDIIDI